MRQFILVTLLLAVICCLGLGHVSGQDVLAVGQSGAEAEVLKVEEEFRLAKLKNDTKALSRVLADDFSETNQNGNSRNKAQVVELFGNFPIKSLTVDNSRVRISNATAVVTGAQTEVNAAGTDRMLFLRVYVRGPAGWQLFASAQFRDPKLEPQAGR